MEIKIRIIENQLCKVHFAVQYSEASANIKKFKRQVEDETAELMLYNYIENNLLEDKLFEKGIIPLGQKDIHYLSLYHEKRPIIGVATFVILPEVSNISLPMSITPSVFEEIKDTMADANNMFQFAMLDNGLFNEVDSEIIDETSIARYQLLYTKNGTVLNTINNQVFDLSVDDDLDPKKFLGAKVGDRVVIDQDDVTIEALITSIKNKVPYSNDSFDVEKINDVGFDTFQEMYDKYMKAYEYINKVDLYFDFIIEFAVEHTEMKLSQAVINFYKNKEYFAFIDDYEDAKTDKEKEKAILKTVFLNLFSKMVDFKTDDKLSDNKTKDEFDVINIENFSDLYSYYECLYLSNDINVEEIYIEILKIKILRYCQKEKIIKGLTIKL